MMDFSPSAAQTELAALTRTIAGDLVDPGVLRASDHSGRPDDKLWRGLADAGVIAAATPRPRLNDAANDGLDDGLGVQEQCAVLTELGRALAPVPVRATTVAGAALARFGTSAQQSRWLEPALTGDLVLTAAPAVTGLGLPATGSLTARSAGDGWELDGTYDLLLAGLHAGLIVADATTPDGTGLFVIDAADPGVTLTAQPSLGGAGTARLELTAVHLTPDRRLDGDTAGWLLQHATVAACAEQTGILDGGLELTAGYTRTREQFGRPIGAFQAVSQRLADAWIDVESLRLTTWNAAFSLDAGLDASLPVATAKFWAAEAGHRVAHTLVHLHGGTGIDLDHGAHRYFTAAKRLEFELGTASAHLLRLGQLLAEQEI
jgi:alkylation response protein AidB-like acyl-CoA dehydrogenase